MNGVKKKEGIQVGMIDPEDSFVVFILGSMIVACAAAMLMLTL